MRRSLLLPAVLLVLPACSGGGGDGPEDRRAAYVDAAEQACTAANEEIAALATPTSIQTIAPYAEQVVQVLEDTVEQVSVLEPPAEDAAELTEKVLDPLVDDVVRAQEYAAEVRTAADAGDGPGLLRLVQEVPQTSADLAFMREYGLEQCASAADTQA